MTKIELFPHNEEAYLDLINSLEDSNFSFIERATGTGKSYILIKFMDNVMKGKRVLFVTLHDSMFKQLSERDMPVLGTSKDIYEKLDCVLYSSINKKSAEWYVENYDCIIFDEAHHVGAPIWSQTIGEIRDLIAASDDKVMIGATATGIRFLDDYMDVAKEFFMGNVANRLYLSEAILREILPAPYYINVNHTLDNLISSIDGKLEKLSNFRELDNIRKKVDKFKVEVNEKTNVSSLLEKYGVKNGDKYIVFCSNIDDLRNKKEEAVEWFKSIGEIEVYEAHSAQSGVVNQSQITAFENSKSDKVKLMFAVDMFNEGLHVKGVDGIIMTRKTTSPIIYLQQLGRVLSFSVRKKQVKVFDLAGNAIDIDIIHNLYKELLAVAKSYIAENVNNLEHYQQIIDRFQIIDEGSLLVDKLEDINKFLDDNYLKRARVSKYISILRNYIEVTKCNFMKLLESNKVDKEHLKIYKELMAYADILTIDDILELNKIGVILVDYQTDEDILEKIKEFGNYKNVKDNNIKELFDSYNLFVLKNNRRPSLDNKEERELALDYRNMLASIKVNYLRKYLKNVSYVLNVEELLILKDYPSRDEILIYLDKIEEKYLNGIVLDELEKKTINSISKIMSLKDRPIIKNLTSNIVFRLDECIKVIEEYKTLYPDERFEDLDYFKNDISLYKSLEFLYKNCKYVTNLQFELLLSLDIKLPKDIDMTLEERKEFLGGFDSLYDREESINKANVKLIKTFINNNNRRPSMDVPEEKELARFYTKLIYERGSTWSTVITDTLIENNIDLTIAEKIIGGIPLTKLDVEDLYDNFIDSINNCDPFTFNASSLRQQLRILKKNNRIDDKLYKIYKRTVTVIDYVYNYNINFGVRKLSSYLNNNQAIIPFSLVTYLVTTYGISFININKNLSYKDKFINIAEKKYEEEIKKRRRYIDYIKTNNERPFEGSVEDSGIRDYLAKSTKYDVVSYVNELNELGISLTIEELYLIGDVSLDNQRLLYEKLLNKRKNGLIFDSLDEALYESLYLKLVLHKDDSFIRNNTSIHELNIEMKSDDLERYKKIIDENPLKPLELDDCYLSEVSKKELEDYRLTKFSDVFISDLINKMIKDNKPYKDILNEEDIELVESLISFCKRKNVNLELIDKLAKLNRSILLEINNIDIQLFISEYLSYLIRFGVVPTDETLDNEGIVLACKYELVKDILYVSEKEELNYKIKKCLEDMAKKDFYTLFIEFVQNNERFPTLLSDDHDERELATTYQKIGKKLPLEQRKTINGLLKKYQMNTLKYAQSKKGR